MFCLTENAKWFLNVQWAMEGVDIHLDVNVGKQLSALGHTLTMLTSVQEDETVNPSYDSDEADTVDNPDASQVEFLYFIFMHKFVYCMYNIRVIKVLSNYLNFSSFLLQ